MLLTSVGTVYGTLTCQQALCHEGETSPRGCFLLLWVPHVYGILTHQQALYHNEGQTRFRGCLLASMGTTCVWCIYMPATLYHDERQILFLRSLIHSRFSYWSVSWLFFFFLHLTFLRKYLLTCVGLISSTKLSFIPPTKVVRLNFSLWKGCFYASIVMEPTLLSFRRWGSLGWPWVTRLKVTLIFWSHLSLLPNPGIKGQCLVYSVQGTGSRASWIC